MMMRSILSITQIKVFECTRRSVFVAVELLSLGCGCRYPQQQDYARGLVVLNSSGSHATVPLHLGHNRPFLDVALTSPSGHSRMARFWVDTGGFILTEPLARELGLPPQATDAPLEGDDRFVPVPAPVATAGDMTLRLEGAHTVALRWAAIWIWWDWC